MFVVADQEYQGTICSPCRLDIVTTRAKLNCGGPQLGSLVTLQLGSIQSAKAQDTDICHMFVACVDWTHVNKMGHS